MSILFLPVFMPDHNISEYFIKPSFGNYFTEIHEEKGYIISPYDFANTININNEITIIDIRNINDFNKGHIPNSIHGWWFDFENIVPLLPKNKKIVIYCYTGQASGQLVGVLRLFGYNAYSLDGGWDNGWIPFYTSKPTQP